MYLYIDEGGSLIEVNGEPTKADVEQVRQGMIYIVRFHDGQYEQLDPVPFGDGFGWTSIDRAKLRYDGLGGEYHSV